MQINIYQTKTKATWITSESPELDLAKAGLGIGGEAGEVQELLKKKLRGDKNPHFKISLAKELGDLMYYVNMVANLEGINMAHVLEQNLLKLQDRANRGVIQGSGNNR